MPRPIGPIPGRFDTDSRRDLLTRTWSQANWADLIHRAATRTADRAFRPWVALVDIDNFKRFNMHNGWAAGDQVLVKLATLLLSLEKDDAIQVVRTGGQEFALVCLGNRNGGDQDGRATCERVLEWTRDSPTPEQEEHCGRPDCVGPTRLTVSIALASIEAGDSAASVSERLRLKMVDAKLAGRDRVESG